MGRRRVDYCTAHDAMCREITRTCRRVPAAITWGLELLIEDLALSPTVADILIAAAAASVPECTVEELLSSWRKGWVVKPRHAAMWVAAQVYGHTHQAIADTFKKERSTVTAAISKVSTERLYDTDFDTLIDGILHHLNVEVAA